MCKIHRHVSSLFLYTRWSGSILLPFCFLASGYIKWMIENRTSHANMTPSILGECLTIALGMGFPHLFCFTSCLQLVLHALLFFCKFIIMQLTSWCFNQMQMGLMDHISLFGLSMCFSWKKLSCMSRMYCLKIHRIPRYMWGFNVYKRRILRKNI